jgi:site-specific recombinase XerD
MNVKKAAQGVLRELEARGYANWTLDLHRRNSTRVERWFLSNYSGEITQMTVSAYLAEIEDRMQSGSIGKSYYDQLRLIAKRLYEYSESKSISIACSPNKREYQPSTESIIMIENALSATELREDFKRKLHVILRKFFCFIEEQGLGKDDITRDVMVSFIHHCRDSNSGNMEYIVRSLRILAKHLASIGIMVREPDFRFIMPKKKRRKIIPAFSEAELAAVLTAIDRSTPNGKRDYAILLLASGTGFRGCDIANLKLIDIDWRSQTISIVQGKTGKPLRMPISGQVCNAISDYILHGRPKVDCANVFLRSRPPFMAFNDGRPLGQILDRACNKAEIEKKMGRRFHSLRRTFGTWLAAEEIQITTIAQMLGHAEIDSSAPYLSFNDAQMNSCAMGFGDIPLKGGVYGEFC